MRILACADLQIGAGAGYLDPKYGPGSRLHDHQEAWVECVRLAIDHSARTIIVAGDVFEEKRPGPTALLAFHRGVALARDHGIQVVAIAGNHDVRSADEPTALEVFGDIAGDDKLSAPEDGLCRVHRVPGWHWLDDETAYAALPWTTIGGLAALRGGGDRDLLHAEAGELLAQVAAGLREQVRQAGAARAILVAHWAVSGAAMPTGISSDELREVVIPAHALAEQGWDAIVLGHIHRSQIVAGGAGFYCGSPLPCDFGEAGYAHGCMLLDLTDDGHVRAEFLPIESRPFVTIDAINDPWIVPQDAIVRVVGQITQDESDSLDRDEIIRVLNAAGAASVRIDIDVERSSRARVETMTSDLGPVQALDAWIDSQDTTADPDTLRRVHLGYLEQEHAA